jgi:hypothetical protein
MEIYLISIILIIVPLARLSLKAGGTYKIKETILFTLSFGYLCYMLLFGYKLVNSYIGYSLFLVVLYITMTATWSSNIEQSWKDIIKWWSLLGLFTMATMVEAKTLLMISMIPIPFFIAYGFMHHYGYEPFDKDLRKYVKAQVLSNRARFLGFMGNTNHAAAFIAPYLFIAIYLTVNVSLWFSLFIPMILVGVYLTQCYSAMVGIFFGLCVIYPQYSLWLLVFIPIGAIVLLIIKKRYSEQYTQRFEKKIFNLTTRFYYWLIAFNLWKKRPIFGWGICAYRKELYECQAEMNKKDDSLLGYKDEKEDIPAKFTPWPERAHNDYVEMLCDGGIIGFILMVTFMSAIVYTAIGSGNYILLGGIICLMVHGFMFYTMSTLSVVPYMVLIAALSQPVVLLYAVPLPIALIGVCIIVKLIVTHVIKIQVAMMYAHRALSATDQIKKEQYIDKAIALDSTNSHICMIAVDLKIVRDKWIALHFAEHAIHCFDGLMQLPRLFLQYGEIQALCGNSEAAHKSFQYALYLNPRLDRARYLLQQMDKAISNQRNQQFMRLVKPAIGGK